MVGEYFDPNYPARVDGQLRGQLEGFAAGRSAGYESGYADGHAAGWGEAIERGNEEMRKQLEFTRQHVERNAQLVKLTEDQHALIRRLEEALEGMGIEQGHLKNELTKHEQRAFALGTDHVWRYNKVTLCLNALRDTMDEVMKTIPSGQDALRAVFVRQYETQIQKALSQGTIRAPLDQDETFARALPKTHGFLLNMLRPG